MSSTTSLTVCFHPATMRSLLLTIGSRWVTSTRILGAWLYQCLDDQRQAFCRHCYINLCADRNVRDFFAHPPRYFPVKFSGMASGWFQPALIRRGRNAVPARHDQISKTLSFQRKSLGQNARSTANVPISQMIVWGNLRRFTAAYLVLSQTVVTQS